jgi:hypothetical protein
MPLFTRVKSILVTPAQEWKVIAGESTTPANVIIQYLLPLAIIPAIALYLSLAMYVGIFTGGYGLQYALISFVEMVITVCINAWIVDKLAPMFASEASFPASLRLMVYASTPIYVASILVLIPGLGMLGMIIGLVYSIYLLYLGIPILKKTPADKVPGYLVAIIVCLIVVYYVLQMILTRIFVFGYVGAFR